MQQTGLSPVAYAGPIRGERILEHIGRSQIQLIRRKISAGCCIANPKKKKGKKALFACTQYEVNKWASVFRIERPNLLVDSWAVWTFANKSLSPITISVLRPYFTFRSSFPSMWFFILVPVSGNHWLSQSRCPPPPLPPPPAASSPSLEAWRHGGLRIPHRRILRIDILTSLLRRRGQRTKSPRFMASQIDSESEYVCISLMQIRVVTDD